METIRTIIVSKELIKLNLTEKNKILSYTSNKYIREGYYKTTIHELVKQMGISKNILYKYFPTKEKLLVESMKYFIKNIKQRSNQILEKDCNASEKLINMFNLIGSHIMQFNEKFLKELQIHNPEVWNSIDKTRKKYAYQIISSLISQGKKEKLFVEYPEEILVEIFIGAFRSVINPIFLLNNNFSVKEAFEYTINILMNAILSEKGKILYKNLKLSQ